MPAEERYIEKQRTHFSNWNPYYVSLGFHQDLDVGVSEKNGLSHCHADLWGPPFGPLGAALRRFPWRLPLSSFCVSVEWIGQDKMHTRLSYVKGCQRDLLELQGTCTNRLLYNCIPILIVFLIFGKMSGTERTQIACSQISFWRFRLLQQCDVFL